MNKVFNLFFRKNFDEFNIEKIKGLQFSILLWGIFLIGNHFYCLFFKTIYIAVKPKTALEPNVQNSNILMKMQIPIKENDFLQKLFIGLPSERSFIIPNLFTMDLIGIILILICINKYLSISNKKGLFNKLSIKWLKTVLLICFIIFPIRLIINILLINHFSIYYPEYSIEKSAYISYGWFYTLLIFSSIIYIFLYGQKIEEENDLTI